MRIDSFTAVTLNSICAPTDGSFFMKHSSADLLGFRDKLRLGYDAIIVGANTIIKDNPTLLNKSRSNFRIVIDEYQNLSLQERIFTSCPERTIVITPFRLCETHYIKRLATIGVNVVTVDDTKNLVAIVAVLEKKGISKLLIEGGYTTINNFLRSGLLDSLQVVIFPSIVSKGGALFDITSNVYLELDCCECIAEKYIYLKYSRVSTR